MPLFGKCCKRISLLWKELEPFQQKRRWPKAPHSSAIYNLPSPITNSWQPLTYTHSGEPQILTAPFGVVSGLYHLGWVVDSRAVWQHMCYHDLTPFPSTSYSLRSRSFQDVEVIMTEPHSIVTSAVCKRFLASGLTLKAYNAKVWVQGYYGTGRYEWNQNMSDIYIKWNYLFCRVERPKKVKFTRL